MATSIGDYMSELIFDKNDFSNQVIDTHVFIKNRLGEPIKREVLELSDVASLLDCDPFIPQWLPMLTGDASAEYVPIGSSVCNSYNREQNFNRQFNYRLYAKKEHCRLGGRNSDIWYMDDMMADPCVVAISVQVGTGDPRGEYGKVKLYFVDDLIETGFFEWVVGWNVQGDNVDSDKFVIGYAPNPTNALEQMLDCCPLYNEELEYFVGRIDTEHVTFRPYTKYWR